MDTLIDTLHQGGYSCVIRKGTEVRTFHQRGVKDLWELCESEKGFLQGAQIADKVIGKGAAALMIYGGIHEVYADVISTPALELLQKHNIHVAYAQQTDRILNRKRDGLCPVETLCHPLQSLEEMYSAITNFIKQKS
ncbi:MAG: DUF1893 domain-containing protein [Bacteroidaceae bacterium]|nr:DUF1893 domain-containing protein [Bacteroidaceae bacterium]